MLAPGTAEPPCEGRARRLLLRFACTALFAGGLWLCGATIAAATEQPDGPPATTQQAVHTAAQQGLDTVARTTAAPTRRTEQPQHTGQAQHTAQSQHVGQSEQGQSQQGGPQHEGQPVGPPGKSSSGLLAEVRDTVHSAVHSTPVLGHALAKQQQTVHERPDQGTEQPPQRPLPGSEQILPASLGSPAHVVDKQTSGTPGGSGSSTTPEPARQHDAAKTAEPGKTHQAKPHRAQPHRAQRASAPVPRSNPAPPNLVTATSTHAAAASQAADHSKHGDPQGTDPQGTDQLPPAHPDAPSANAGHSGANGDRGGNGGMFALTTGHQLFTVDPVGTSARAAAVRYASADRLRPGVAPD